MNKNFNDPDEYREKRQEAYAECCVEAYGLVAEALRHLGVAGGDNHDIIRAEEQPLIFNENIEEAIEQLRRAGAILYNTPFVSVPERIGPRRLWSVGDENTA